MKNQPLPIAKLLRLAKTGDSFYVQCKDRDVVAAANRLRCRVTTERRKVISKNTLLPVVFVTVTEAMLSPGEIDREELVSALQWAKEHLGKHTRPSPIDNLLNLI